MAGKFS